MGRTMARSSLGAESAACICANGKPVAALGCHAICRRIGRPKSPCRPAGTARSLTKACVALVFARVSGSITRRLGTDTKMESTSHSSCGREHASIRTA